MTSSLPQFAAASAAFIARRPAPDDPQFEPLALALFAFQFEHNPAYRALCERPGWDRARVRRWQDIPAVPTTAFKDLELSVLPPPDRTGVFQSSGTTQQRPSRHCHNADSLAVYEASLLAWAEPHLRLQTDGVRHLCFLPPPPAVAPQSSLVHMLETLRQASGGARASFHGVLGPEGDWRLDFAGLQAALSPAIAAREPVALFGTAFNVVQLLDELTARGQRLLLPPGSRLMETGGYKGRSRTLARPELHGAATQALGIAPPFVITEYGMSELGSQAYDTVTGGMGPRRLRFPPWARALVVSPENGAEVPDGGTGLLRVYDLANVASVLAVQTEDLVVRRGDGFEWVARAALSEPRGCSLMTA